MGKLNRRTRKTPAKLRSAVGCILDTEKELTPYNFSLAAIARQAGLSVSTVKRYVKQLGGGSSPWRLLERFDDEIRVEFTARRAVQVRIGVGKSTGDFFMR